MAGFAVHNAPLNAEECSPPRLKQHCITAYAFSAGRMKRPRDGVYRVTHVRFGVDSVEKVLFG
jgi:hypothetical protein